MIIYSLIMAATGIAFLVIGIAVRHGRADLIHDYHQRNIDPSLMGSYCRELSVGLLGICVSCFASGAISLLGKTRSMMLLSVGALFAGFAVSIVILLKVQKKYNNGLF